MLPTPRDEAQAQIEAEAARLEAESSQPGEVLHLWHALAPPSQAVLVRVSTLPAHTLRVEHLLRSLLQESSTVDAWPHDYEAHERAHTIEQAGAAVARTRSLLAQLGVDAGVLERGAALLAHREPSGPAAARRMSLDHRDVWQMAVEEARAMSSPLVWPEHLVLAMLKWARPRSPWWPFPLRRDEAEQVLAALPIDIGVARVVAREALQNDLEDPTPWTLRVQKAVDAAHALAMRSGSGRIAPAHLLLALLRDEDEARDALRFLQVEEPERIDLELLRAQAKALARSDGEAATHRPRFSKDSARVLEAAKKAATRAGLRRIDLPLLLLNLALHGGEQTAPLRQVLERAMGPGGAQVLADGLYYPPLRHQRIPDGPEVENWRAPRGALNWAAFLTTPVCVPVGAFFISQSAARPALLALGVSFIVVWMAGLVASVFALWLGRPAKFKLACENFLAGFGFTAMLYMLGSLVWHIVQCVPVL
jgi:hypothetical protein